MESWKRAVEKVLAAGGSVVRLEPGAGIRQYERSERVTRWLPSPDVLSQHQPRAYTSFVAEHGFPLVSMPESHPLAFLPPRAAAQATTAVIEPGRPWSEVVAERDAGRYTWRWVLFATFDLTDVHGWAFGPHPEQPESEPVVWYVEDSLPLRVEGTFSEWLRQRAAELEARLARIPEDFLELTEEERQDELATSLDDLT